MTQSDRQYLAHLLAEVRRLPVTPERREAFRRDFVYGSARLEDPGVTREKVADAAERLALTCPR